MTKSEGFTRWLEGNAQGMRQLTGMGATERLVPRLFAKALGYTIVFPAEVQGLSSSDLRQLTHVDASGWSGSSAVLPNGHPVVLLNPTDTVTRNNITIMEELAHDYLGHRPSLSGGGKGHMKRRDFSGSQERQAYALGAATALPSRRLEVLVRGRLKAHDIARVEELSMKVVLYRLNVSGIGRATASIMS